MLRKSSPTLSERNSYPGSNYVQTLISAYTMALKRLGDYARDINDLQDKNVALVAALTQISALKVDRENGLQELLGKARAIADAALKVAGEK